MYYRRSGGDYRVWRGDWQGDMFETLTPYEFENLKSVCVRFGILLVDQDDLDAREAVGSMA
jgi:hypothetical protein